MRKIQIGKLYLLLVGTTYFFSVFATHTVWAGDLPRCHSRPCLFSLEIGPSYMTHYNLKRVNSTPPAAFLAEIRPGYWIEYFLEVYGIGGADLNATTYEAGGGLRIPFATFHFSTFFIETFSLNLNVEVLWYHTAEALSPYEYKNQGLLFRYGGSIAFHPQKSRTFFELSGVATYFSSNFFVAPFAGVGFFIF
ncbi:MAG: hypothetical protein AB7F43_11255 [Bacteriovoracia bacterium]